MNYLGNASHFASDVSWEINRSFFFIITWIVLFWPFCVQWIGSVYVWAGFNNVWGTTSGGHRCFLWCPGEIALSVVWRIHSSHASCSLSQPQDLYSMPFIFVSLTFLWCNKRVDIYYCNYKQSEEMYDLFCQFGLFLKAPQHPIKNILMYVVIYVVNCIFHSLVKHILHIYLTFPILLLFTLVLYLYFGNVHRRR